jgi:hypothetical protein
LSHERRFSGVLAIYETPTGTECRKHALLRILLRTGTISEPYRNSLGHKDVKTTMIYTHVLNRGGKGVRSPLDGLKIGSGKGSYTDLYKTTV